jgi:hypothetical protein
LRRRWGGRWLEWIRIARDEHPLEAQDRKQIKADRVKINRVQDADYGLNFLISYASQASNEGLEVEISLMDRDLNGPFINKIEKSIYDPKTGAAQATLVSLQPVGAIAIGQIDDVIRQWCSWAAYYGG